jgi:hypothetical protein
VNDFDLYLNDPRVAYQDYDASGATFATKPERITREAADPAQSLEPGIYQVIVVPFRRGGDNIDLGSAALGDHVISARVIGDGAVGPTYSTKFRLVRCATADRTVEVQITRPDVAPVDDRWDVLHQVLPSGQASASSVATSSWMRPARASKRSTALREITDRWCGTADRPRADATRPW